MNTHSTNYAFVLCGFSHTAQTMLLCCCDFLHTQLSPPLGGQQLCNHSADCDCCKNTTQGINYDKICHQTISSGKRVWFTMAKSTSYIPARESSLC